jgi:hypothetical protein
MRAGTARAAVMSRGLVVVAALSFGCASDDSDSSQQSAGGKAPDATTGATGGRGEGDAGPSSGGAAGSGGVSPLRHEECVISEGEDRCVPSREVSGWHCCDMRGGEYHRDRGCKDEPNRLLGCWATQTDPNLGIRYCGGGPAWSCMMDGDGTVYHATVSYPYLAAAGLVECSAALSSSELASEVATAPYCEPSLP